MKLLSPTHRRILPFAIFVTLFFHVFWLWAFARFLHRDAQSRSLAPEHYDVQVVTAADYRRLADPAVRVVKFDDGTTLEKAPVWERIVLPNFKPTDEGKFYVLVTTKGTAHFLSYVEPHYFMIAFFAACGIAACAWNLRPSNREPTGLPDGSID